MSAGAAAAGGAAAASGQAPGLWKLVFMMGVLFVVALIIPAAQYVKDRIIQWQTKL